MRGRRSVSDFILQIRVVPNAKKTEVVGRYGEGYKIKLHAPPVDGKANAVLLDFLKETLGASVQLISGEKSRDKKIRIAGMSGAEVSELLGRIKSKRHIL
jgi:uncharacterized protein (TIGR00251 family)